MPSFTSLKRLNPEEDRPDFDCGDDDLNEFFSADSQGWDRQLLSVTYIALDDDNDEIAFFCVSNDAIKKADDTIPDNRYRRVVREVPHPKRISSMPAVKIGRLGVKSSCQSQGIGGDILDYIKSWFTQGNKTGCRYVLVDAYNDPRAIKFYQDNGFDFLLLSDEGDTTRLMFFDLMTFRP